MCPSTSQVTCHHVSPRSHATAGPSPSGRRAGGGYGPGDMVVVRAEDVTVLGQVLEVVSRRRPEPRPTSPRRPWARMVIGTLDADGVLRRRGRPPFSSPRRPRRPRRARGPQRSAAAGLTVGTWHTAGDRTTAELRAAASTGTRSSVARAARERPTHSESSSSGSSWAPTCGSSSWIPTPTSCASGRPRTARPGRGRAPRRTGACSARLLAQRGHGAVADALPDDGPKGPGGGRAARPGARPRRVQRLHHPARAARGRGLGRCSSMKALPPSSDSPAASRTSVCRSGRCGLRPPVGRRCRHRSAGGHRHGPGGFGDPAEPLAICLEVVDELWAARPAGADPARHRRGAQPLQHRSRQPRRSSCSLTGSSRSRRRGGSTVSGFCSPHSDRPRSTPRSSASATTSCSCG